VHATPVAPSEREGYDTHGIHMPGQSWYPVLAALSIFIACYGILYKNFILAPIAGLMLVVCVYAWAFEGVGGTHVHPGTPAEEHA
jgi:cytochrome c oxidase subunit 1